MHAFQNSTPTVLPPTSRRGFLTGIAAAAAGAALFTSAADADAIARFRPAGDGGVEHGAFDVLLRRFVKPDAEGYNRVDYKTFKTEGQRALKAYLASLEAQRPSAFSPAEAHAFWINLYNAKTLDIVLDRYPVSSIKKINLGGGGLFGGGPWSKRLIAVDGEALSLDDIEHRIVRPLFNDPLSHYALNCASYSCPNLAVSAFTGKNMGALMDANARVYVNHPRGIRIAGNAITASKIYSWYAGDFGGRKNLKAHWKQFAEPSLASDIDTAEIGGFDYDWSLNDV